MSESDVKIEGMGRRGEGVARLDDRTVFVPGTLPDETVKAVGDGDRLALVAIERGWDVTAGADAATLERGRMVAKTQLMAHLASAFSVFSLAFLAVPLAVRVGRAETFVNAAVALAIALTYYLLTSMAGYVKDPAYRPDLLVWLPNLIVVTLGWFLLRRASRH